jgi:hypothetical protein
MRRGLARSSPNWGRFLLVVGSQECVLTSYDCDLPPLARGRDAAREIRNGAVRWTSSRGGHVCPELDDLVRYHEIDRPLVIDPLGHSYRLACEHEGISVSSAGPDGTFGTADDVIAVGSLQ